MSDRAGLRLERIVATEKRYLIETMGGGVAFIDYDQDGWLDIYLTNSPTVQSFKSGRLPANRLYRNSHDGTFSDVSEKAGVAFRGWCMGVSVADYNNDGYPDLYLTNFGPNVLYRNNGDGTFTNVTKQAGPGDARWSTSSGWADYDGDGHLDLFVAGYVEYELDRLPEFGRGRYCLYKSLEVLCGPRGMMGAGDTLYRNNGDGTFTDVSRKAGVADERGYYGLGVAWGDLDDDNDQDLYVANDTQANYLYLNQGGGIFREAGLLSGAALDANGKARAGMGIAVGDYDRDGKLDIGVTNFSDEAYALFRNQGSANFIDMAFPTGIGRVSLPYLGWGMFFGDFDNDGWSDLFAANGHVYPQVDRIDIGTRYKQRCLIYRNLGPAGFADVTSDAGVGINTPRAHRGAALGDYDNDGDLDILILDLDGNPVLLENRSQPQGNYLRVKAPVGSRITIIAAKLKQMDEVRASGSYQSASEQIAHFGLGNTQIIESLMVRFPNGKTKTLTDVKVNQLLTINQEVR
ncbi:MAG: CRTAC1 family protein [Acidobacteria bacterium]|nr:CRTAC1 family protein [Acidobacteriota bacterium]